MLSSFEPKSVSSTYFSNAPDATRLTKPSPRIVVRASITALLPSATPPSLTEVANDVDFANLEGTLPQSTYFLIHAHHPVAKFPAERGIVRPLE
jgi:hypothetical protein